MSKFTEYLEAVGKPKEKDWLKIIESKIKKYPKQLKYLKTIINKNKNYTEDIIRIFPLILQTVKPKGNERNDYLDIHVNIEDKEIRVIEPGPGEIIPEYKLTEQNIDIIINKLLKYPKSKYFEFSSEWYNEF